MSESSSRPERLLLLNEKTREQGNESHLKSNETSFARGVKGTALDRTKLLIKLDGLKNRDRERVKLLLAEKQTSRQSNPGKTASHHHKFSAVRILQPIPETVVGNLEQSFTKNNVNEAQILNGFTSKFEEVKIPKSRKMGLSMSKIGKAGKLEKQSKLKIDHNGMGERRIAGSYEAIRKSVMRKQSAGERGIERVDTGEISLVGEMAERMKELAINGSVGRENAGERMVGVGLKGIKKDIKIRQGLVREAKKRTGDIKSESVIKERSRQQDETGYRWAKEGNEGKQVLGKGKEIQNRIKGGKKFGSAGKEIMIQGEQRTKELEMEFEGMRKYGTSGHKQMKRITEGERRVLIGQGEKQNRLYEDRKLATGGTERVMQVKQRIKEQSTAREDMRETGQHRIQRVNEEKERLHEGNKGERRIFLGEIGTGNEELGNYEPAKARVKNLNTLQGVSGEGIVEVKEGERGVVGVHRKVQGEKRKRKKASSKETESERQGELRIATNTGKLKQIFKEKKRDEEGAWRGNAVLGGIKKRMIASMEQREPDRRIGRVDEGQRRTTRTQEGNEEEIRKKMEKHREQAKQQTKSEQIVPRMETGTKEGWDNWLGELSKEDIGEMNTEKDE